MSWNVEPGTELVRMMLADDMVLVVVVLVDDVELVASLLTAADDVGGLMLTWSTFKNSIFGNINL